MSTVFVSFSVQVDVGVSKLCGHYLVMFLHWVDGGIFYKSSQKDFVMIRNFVFFDFPPLKWLYFWRHFQTFKIQWRWVVFVLFEFGTCLTFLKFYRGELGTLRQWVDGGNLYNFSENFFHKLWNSIFIFYFCRFGGVEYFLTFSKEKVDIGHFVQVKCLLFL